MYIYMNTCVCMCEHMCIYIYMCVSILLGETCLQTGTLTTHLGDTDLLSFSPALTSLALGGFEERQAEEETSAITVLD